ncbi:MAG TPA: 4'-phosphopantetheinyl transferase superfamily protein, partial [Flavobacteriales bacterium]|nr:4'-phosphopantetheinyl transferase superfamily protein [Flavobacteriales bacterium]
DVQLWFALLSDLLPRIAELENLLDPVEIERAHRFRSPHDRERFVLGHGALRELLGRYVGSEAADLRFARGPYGKPFLEGNPIHFNFSDTKDAILIGVARSPLGVDVETMAREVDHRAVSEHYFTAEEITAIREAGEGSKRRFLDYWTRKEAILKASGVGIMEDLRVLRVDAVRNAMTIEHEAFIEHAAPEYRVRTWHVGEEHCVSLAMSDVPREMSLYSITR